MNYFSTLFIGSIGACLLSSCTHYFDLDKVAEPSKLVVYCYPGIGDTTVVHLSRSIPVNETDGDFQNIKNADVRISANGNPIQLQRTDKALPGVPAQSYYALTGFKENDRIELAASAEGMQPVSAQTTIPTSFPLNYIRMEKKRSSSNTLQFQLNFNDNGYTDNYYAVTLETKWMEWRNENYSEGSERTYLDLSDEPLLHTSGLDDVILNDKNFYQNLYYWNDKQIQGKSYTLRLNTLYYADYDETYDYGNEQEHVIAKRKYRITLYTLSEEFYKYLKSINDQQNNDLSNSELAPMRITYTNVNRGLGIVGGCRLIRTEWIDNLQEDETSKTISCVDEIN